VHQATKLNEIYHEAIGELASADTRQPETLNRLIARVQLIKELMTRLRREEPKAGVLIA